MCIPNQARGQQLIEPADLARANVRLDVLRRHIESDRSDLSDLSDVHFWRQLFAGKRHVFGYDIGRTGDLTSIWVNRISGSTAALAALVTMRGVRFENQKAVVRALLEAGAAGAGDKTGLGMAVCEDLEEHFAGSFTGVNFASAKIQLGTMLQSAFEAGNQQIPLEYPEVKADLAAVKKETTSVGRLIFAEGRNELLPASHCDLAWSAALALYAAQELDDGPCRFMPAGEHGDKNHPRRGVLKDEKRTWL
jgi:phage FluMu gp28-like protein